jgi:hypothetical protein
VVIEIGEDGLSSYERERLANLERNRQMMEQLGLLDASRKLAESARGPRAAPAKPRGLAPARRKPEQLAPERRSLRAMGKTPDGQFAAGVHTETVDGTVVVMVDGKPVSYNPASNHSSADGAAAERERAQREAKLRSDAPFVSLNASRPKDEALLQILRSSDRDLSERAAATPKSGAKAGKAEAACALGELTGLSLAEAHVAKVTPRDIVHLGFQPRSDRLLLAAADKGGHVALWDVGRAEESKATARARAEEARGAMEREEQSKAEAEQVEQEGEEGGEEEGDNDGVFLFRPHAQYVSGLKWAAAQPHRLYTASYDGTVRYLDLGKPLPTVAASSAKERGSSAPSGSFRLCHYAEDHEISTFEIDQSGATAYFADNHGMRARAPARAISALMPTCRSRVPTSAHSRRVWCVGGGRCPRAMRCPTALLGASAGPARLRPAVPPPLLLPAHSHCSAGQAPSPGCARSDRTVSIGQSASSTAD